MEFTYNLQRLRLEFAISLWNSLRLLLNTTLYNPVACISFFLELASQNVLGQGSGYFRIPYSEERGFHFCTQISWRPQRLASPYLLFDVTSNLDIDLSISIFRSLLRLLDLLPQTTQNLSISIINNHKKIVKHEGRSSIRISIQKAFMRCGISGNVISHWTPKASNSVFSDQII